MAVKQYELVAERLRQRVVHGELQPGERLPNEAVLATDYGVSRATVREALRVLATQSLIRTSKGAGGGSYVTLPSVNGVSEYVQSSISLLADADDVTLEQLRDAIPDEPLRLGTQRQFVYNQDFHLAVIDGCRNALLAIAAQPVFAVLQRNLARSKLGAGFHRTINEHHRAIAAAIEAGDADAAGGEMYDHLEYLRPYYQRAWRNAR